MSAVRLGDNAKLIRGITFKPVDKCDPHDEGTVVCMRTKNVQATLDASELIAVPRSLVRNSEKMLSTGDILVSSANSSNLVGKCCQVPNCSIQVRPAGFISILRPKTEKLESRYLYRWFSSDVFVQRRLRSFANQTTNISNCESQAKLKSSKSPSRRSPSRGGLRGFWMRRTPCGPSAARPSPSSTPSSSPPSSTCSATPSPTRRGGR